MNKYKVLPYDFENIHQYLTNLLFCDNNFDDNMTIDGKLWLLELYMKA